MVFSLFLLLFKNTIIQNKIIFKYYNTIPIYLFNQNMDVIELSILSLSKSMNILTALVNNLSNIILQQQQKMKEMENKIKDLEDWKNNFNDVKFDK